MYNIDLMSLVSELACSPIQEFNTILTSRTMWFGKIINYFQPQNEVDVHLTIYKIQDLIEKNPSVLKQPVFIRDAIQLTKKLGDHIDALFERNPNSENTRLFSFIFSLEEGILTCISGDQTKNLEVMQLIKSRLVPENVIPYLVSTNFRKNISLATACCSYIEENRAIGLGKLSEYLEKNPEKILLLLNVGCLGKSDFVVKTIWEVLCLNKNFEIFRADKRMTSALDYLINKREYSNQTLTVGDLQNPQKILVNREILMQKNTYFQGLFQENFLEGAQSVIILKGLGCTEKLQNIDYEGFLCLLRYIYTGEVDVPLDLCLIVSHLADIYLEPGLKKICDKKKWDQAVLMLKDKKLIGKFQGFNYKKFFSLVHEMYTGKTDASSVIALKDLGIEKLQDIDCKEVLYLLHYIYTGDEDVPLDLCPGISYLADMYSESDLKKICDQKML